jgi:Calcineurin-like phosphoesterase/Purple acid Phosphatase, N-terminal domain
MHPLRRAFSILTAVLLVGFIAMAADAQTTNWQFDTVNSEALGSWRFLAVGDDAAPVPDIDPTHIAIVDLPWQLERTRPKGFYLNTVTVPARFSNRQVLLQLETVGLTRVYFDGALSQESRQGPRSILLVPLPENDSTTSIQIAVSVTHGDTPARFNKAKLVAVPRGFRDMVARRNTLLGSFPQHAVDAAGGTWKVLVRGPKDSYKPDFDDSAWKVTDRSFRWGGLYTPCWYRGHITVPESIGGIPTKGRALNLRARFDDKGKIYINGEALPVSPSPEGTTAFALPERFAPGDDLFIAIDLLNNWGEGGLNALEWRFTALDAAERELHTYRTELVGIDRILRMHDAPDPAWIDELNTGLDTLEKGLQDIDQLPGAVTRTRASLDSVRALKAQSPILLLEPYLQDTRQDRVTVMWETSAPVTSYVEYRVTGTNIWKRLDAPDVDNAIYEADIVGLKPDTAYDYRVVSGNYRGSQYSFRTAPATKRAFSFIVWGDNRSDPDMCEKVSIEMDKEDVEFVLNVGDVVGRGSRWHEWTEHYLIPVRHWSHKWPSYVAIGNHEYGGILDNGPVPGFDQYLAHPTIEPGSTEYWYSFDYSNAHFLFIDGNRFKEDISDPDEEKWTIQPDDPQLAWIEQDLIKAQKTAQWIFVFIHAPPYSEGWSGGYYNGEPSLRNSLVPLLESHGVDIVFAGHTHDYERGLPHPPFDPKSGSGNNAVYIITGGGGASLDNHKYYEWDKIDIPDHVARPDSDETDEGEYYKYHYITVEIDGGKLDFEAKEVLPDGRNAGIFDRFKLDK